MMSVYDCQISVTLSVCDYHYNAFFSFIKGCEECNNANPGACMKHGPLYPIANRPVMSKARASLPLVLYIDHFHGGVYSKRRIPIRTQFGPVEGPLVSRSELKDSHFQLKVGGIYFVYI